MRNFPIVKEAPLIASKAKPRLQRIDSSMLPFLADRFRKHTRHDSYLLSPAYFSMTGRKGLWAYGDDNTLMMLARHPNTTNKLLLFPPIGASPTRLLRSLYEEKNLPDNEFQMARLGPEDRHLEIELKRLGLLRPHKEHILDWTFPVHVLDTALISKRSGPKFRDFRQNINRALRRDICLESIDASNTCQIEKVRNITANWATSRIKCSYTDLVSPVQSTLELMQSKKLPLHGILTYEHSKPIGFIIWEETDPTRGIANSIAALSIGGKGTDEFAILKMCEKLQKNGFHEVCIGGSETPGLDSFKRKMNPIRSVSLSSSNCEPNILSMHITNTDKPLLTSI